MSEKIVLIDGNSILNRAFYGVPDLSNSEGFPTNAVYGFLNILFKILDEEKPEYLTVAFDVKAPTFRHEMYKEYKGTRKPMPEELREQVPVMKELLSAMGIQIVEKAGLEADDILGTLAKKMEKNGKEVSLISGDRDLLQIASEHIKIRIPKTKRGTTEIENYHTADVLERYGVTPEQIIELKALMGDASDNIPGVPGIGEKTAASLIKAYGNIENAYAHVDEIKPKRAMENLKEHYDMAVLSKRLATIEIDADFDFQLDQAKLGNVFTKEAYPIFKRLELKNYIRKFEGTQTQERKEERFTKLTELSDAEAAFENAKKQDRLAFYLIIENGVKAISFGYGEENIYYLEPEGFLTESYLLGRLNEVLRAVKEIVTIDLKAELPYLELEEEGEDKFFDAGIAVYLLNPLKSVYTYDDIAKEHLDRMLPASEDLFVKGKPVKQMEEKPEEFMRYTCYHSYVALLAADILKEKLTAAGMKKLFDEIEMPLVFTLFRMEQAGTKIASEELKEYGTQLAVRIEELEKSIHEQAGEEFNINSPKQLGEILFDKLKLPNGKKTKTGYSTAADVLEKLAPDHPIVASVLEYRQLTKLKSTYADGLANYIGKDGRIHSNFQQTITATGRLSSTEPNLQNIPIRMELGRLIRKVFIPAEDYVLIDADYSQIELRVLAHMSGDERLIQAYREAQDIHRITASQVFHVPFDEVTSLQRRNAKAVNFGIVYGISSFGLSQDLSITRKEAADYIERYFETYPQVKAFLDKEVSDAKETGFAVTMFGRKRPMPELNSVNFMQRSFGERVAMNAPIQGTAADIIKIAMIRVDKRLREEKMKSRLILQVHDELLVEAHKDETERVKEIMKTEMQGAADLHVSLEIDMHEGKNWYEAH